MSKTQTEKIRERKEAIHDHWTVYEDELFRGKRARCNHCLKNYAANVTTQGTHLKTCEAYIQFMIQNGQTSDIFKAALEARRQSGTPTTPAHKPRGRPPNSAKSSNTRTPVAPSPNETIQLNSNDKRVADGPAEPPNVHKRAQVEAPSRKTTKDPKSIGRKEARRESQATILIPVPVPVDVSTGYLRLPQEGVSRYIENFHWAHFQARSEHYRELLDGKQSSNRFEEGGFASEMVENLKFLPDRPVSDTLLYAYFIAIHPIIPLVSTRDFKDQYNKFWEWCRNSETSQPDRTILKDPTFICVFWAILYAGAVAAPTDFWTTATMRHVDRGRLITQLKGAFTSVMDSCKAIATYPTENTLIASLLNHNVCQSDLRPIDDLVFVGQAVREAQYLGLHSPMQSPEISKAAFDRRRRLWFHIVLIDSHSAKAHGVNPVCGDLHPSFRDDMVAELNIQDSPNSVAQAITPPMALALCRFEAGRIESFILQNSRSKFARQSDIDFASEQIRRLAITINQIMAAIPAKGVPEEGFISGRLANAKPLVDKELYKESNGSEPTVFGCWTRVVLTMIKHELDTTLYKAMLDRPGIVKVEDPNSIWQKLAQPCTAYLRAYLQLIRTTSFAPYMWYIAKRPPLQAIMCLLKYLEQQKLLKGPESQLAQLATYLVDEVFDAIESVEGLSTNTDEITVDTSIKAENQRAWQLFHKLKKQLDSSHSSTSNREYDADTILASQLLQSTNTTSSTIA